jgi:hypothetical protein
MSRNPIPNAEMPFNIIIQRLEEKILMMKKCEELSLYFLPVSRSRQTYIIEMRKQVAVYLLGIGANKSDISKVFGQKPCTMIHLLEINNHKHVVEEVSNNHLKWIELGLYPKSINKLIVNEFSLNGYSTKLDYVLVTAIRK